MAPEFLWWGGPDGLRLSESWFVYLVGERITVKVWYPFSPENARQAARPFDDLLVRGEPKIAGGDQAQRNGVIVSLAFDVVSQVIEKYLTSLAQKGIDFDFEVAQGSVAFGDYRAVKRSCWRKFDIQLLPPSPLGRSESVCYRVRIDGLEHVVEILLMRAPQGTRIQLIEPPQGPVYAYDPLGGAKDLKEEQRAYDSYFEFCALRLALLRGALCQVIEDPMRPTKPEAELPPQLESDNSVLAQHTDAIEELDDLVAALHLSASKQAALNRLLAEGWHRDAVMEYRTRLKHREIAELHKVKTSTVQDLITDIRHIAPDLVPARQRPKLKTHQK